jgi:hypothetical protein
MKSLRVVLILAFFAFSLSALDKTKVFILHSYSQEYEWTKNQHDGFVSALNASGGNFEFYAEYLDTKRLKLTPEYMNEFIRYIKAKYAGIVPDVIYATDDNALDFIYANHPKIYKEDSLPPVFFSGVNDLEMDAVLPKNLFCGVFEVKEIKPNIELVRQFSPQTRDVYVVGDDSNTYESIQKKLKVEESAYPSVTFHYASDERLSQVLRELPRDEKIFVILTTIGGFKNDDDSTMLPKESIKKLKENRNLVILTMEDAYMEEGVVGGYLTSGKKQGEQAANLVLKYLKNASLEGLSSLREGSNEYMFDARELVKARILLSQYVSRISTIIHRDKNFIQDNKLLIFEILVAILLVAIFGLTAMYALAKKELARQVEELNLVDANKSVLYSKEALLERILQEENMGYWKANAQTDKLCLSDALADKLRINVDIYENDKDLLTYFVHFDDKKLFYDKLQEVKSSKESLVFHHRMINANNDLLNVKHFLYFERLKTDSPANVVGIIKFEA